MPKIARKWPKFEGKNKPTVRIELTTDDVRNEALIANSNEQGGTC